MSDIELEAEFIVACAYAQMLIDQLMDMDL